ALAGGGELARLAGGRLGEPPLLRAAVDHTLGPPASGVPAGRVQTRRNSQRWCVGPARARGGRRRLPRIERGRVDAEVPGGGERERGPPESMCLGGAASLGEPAREGPQ